MRIQVLSQSFYPDHNGISLYSSGFAFYASEKGHDVEVIAGYGFYPQWKKSKEDKGKLLSTEYYRNVKILRAYIYVPAKPTTFNRVFHEFSLLGAALINFFRAKKPDVIVVFTTPILLGFITAIFKRLYKCKLVINVQDFQLEAANSLNMTKSNFLFNILSKLERWSYKQADLVTSISFSMCDVLKYNKQLPETKIDLWPNWIQKSDYIVREDRQGIFRKAHGLTTNDKIIAYAGNVGLKQGLEIFIDLADAYKQNIQLKFFIIGQGAALQMLRSYAANKNVKNLFFVPLLNPAEYLEFLNDLDVFFLPQSKTEFDVYFPSKLLGLMAAKKIILLSADKNSELYKTIEGNKIGFVTEYGDLKALKIRLNEILNDQEKNDSINLNADLYVSQFEKNIVLDGMLKKMENL